MLVVLEGIDAAGKTTLSRMLAADLRSEGVDARAFDKKAIPAELADDASTLGLNRLIWPEHDAGEDCIGALPRLHLLAAWYAVISRHLSAVGDASSVHVADGWYFRNLVKTELRTAIPAEALSKLFRFAVQPHAVVLLDASPAVAWGRRTAWKSWEIGRWDGQHGSADQAFVAYQSAVRKGLLALAARGEWLRIEEPIALAEASRSLTAHILRAAEAASDRSSALRLGASPISLQP